MVYMKWYRFYALYKTKLMVFKALIGISGKDIKNGEESIFTNDVFDWLLYVNESRVLIGRAVSR